MPEATLPPAAETELSRPVAAGTDPPNPLAWADAGFAYTPPAQPPAHPADGPAALRGEADVAVRARINAFVLDGLIIGLLVGPLLVAAGVAAGSPTWLLYELGVQFVYFFALEAVSGQTIGKRVFHVRVVSLDGAPITVGQAAIRSVLRFADALPLLYASGLISMMRTGPARRQRIGDVVAGTMIVLESGGRRMPTPRWLLPLATLLATAVSVLLIVVLANAPGSPQQIAPGVSAGPIQAPAVAGFVGGTSQRPTPGYWLAHATVTSSVNYPAEPVGSSFPRAWRITRLCMPAGGCTHYQLTRQIAGGGAQVAPLIRQADGWHATFPPLSLPCARQPDGQLVYWLQQTSFVLRFGHGGRTAQASEGNFSSSPGCGSGASTLAWTAARV